MGHRESLGWFVYALQGAVMADICAAHGHLRQLIYPRPPDQASDLPEFVRLEGGPYRTAQFLTFHLSSHFQLPVSLYHSNPARACHAVFHHGKGEEKKQQKKQAPFPKCVFRLRMGSSIGTDEYEGE